MSYLPKTSLVGSQKWLTDIQHAKDVDWLLDKNLGCACMRVVERMVRWHSME